MQHCFCCVLDLDILQALIMFLCLFPDSFVVSEMWNLCYAPYPSLNINVVIGSQGWICFGIINTVSCPIEKSLKNWQSICRFSQFAEASQDIIGRA